MNQHATAAENQAWVRDAVARHGLTEVVEKRAVAAVAKIARETWDDHWATAYSYGHNVLHLGGRRLAHFAHAYADIAEEVDALVPDLEMTVEAFWLQWNVGTLFEGTADGDWHLATR